MNIQDFIEELKQKEITVSFSAGKLKYSGPDENITPELIQNLAKYKAKLIKHFWPRELSRLMPINSDGNRKPIFIVHGDKGNYVISNKLGPDQPVYGFFHPGSEGERINYRSVKEMATDYLKMVKFVSPTDPYYLIGFSFGGVLAYEMAVQLQKSGQKVPFLVIIDSISPLAKSISGEHQNFLKNVGTDFTKPIRKKIRRFIKVLICNIYLSLYNQIPVNRRNYYMWDKYLNLTTNYRPERFDGDILLFRTTENPSSDRYLGWDSLVKNIKMFEIDGKHLEIFIGERRIVILQDEIEKYLENIMAQKV